MGLRLFVGKEISPPRESVAKERMMTQTEIHNSFLYSENTVCTMQENYSYSSVVPFSKEYFDLAPLRGIDLRLLS